MRAIAALLLGLAGLLTSAAQAQTALWAEMARQDLAAAQRLIAENHPGAVPSRGDTIFLAALDHGYRDAAALAARARSYRDYRAVLLRFAAAFGDGHIGSSPRLASEYRWPGFLVALVDGQWVVLPHEDGNLPPPGSALLSCDGRPPDQLADERIGPYVQGWAVPARRAARSVRLLLDRGETPFEPFRACEFRDPQGRLFSRALEWRGLPAQDVPGLVARARPAAGQQLGLARWREGWWIRLGTLGDAAAGLVDQVRAQRESLQAAPYVVVDLRGNGGGNSDYAAQIAAFLVGSAAVRAAGQPAGAEGTAPIWRASAGNLATLDSYLQRFSRQPELVREIQAARTAMTEALRAHRPFARIAAAPGEPGRRDELPVPARPPRLFLVTDGRCFSSCLLAAQLFRALGAVHVGQATDANMHYSEVREIVLPSGLSTFSTLQAYLPALPARLGPFEPSARLSDAVLADDERVREALAAMVH